MFEKYELLKTPQVSIIIPVYNKADLTEQCLRAIVRTTPADLFEIVIVDNGSTDGTQLFLNSLEGDVTIITNQENLGFATACNQGAKEAKGKYILFLNNDTIPQPHWLEELVRTAESDKNVGIVGNKLLYPNGTIQHAGVAVWKNRRPYHIYKDCPADLPAANIERDYQIVTAACMLVRKETFYDVEGFDTQYFNGMEDVDLCLKVGQKNKRVVYNPKSVVIHLESQTEGRQDYMDANRVLFEQRWRDKIREDDLFFLKQDGMEAMVDLDGSFYFVSTKELRQINKNIIIVTYNSSSTIRACLDSVLQYTPGAEIFVVDNASADNTQSILTEYKGRITEILNTENKGFSFACNQGIRASKGEYVILLNPDTIVTPMWAERMLAHFRPGFGAVGPLTNYTTSTQLSSFYAKDRENWETLKTNERAEKLYEWNRGQGRETKLLVGFCLALPRKVLNEVGLLDEDLFLGSEDLEISWRLRQKGYKLMIAADAFIYHEGQVSFRSVEKRPSTKESDQKLYEKLAAHYGQGNVPHPMEIWGVDYFQPEGARFRSPSLSEGKDDYYKISPNPSFPKRGTFGTFALPSLPKRGNIEGITEPQRGTIGTTESQRATIESLSGPIESPPLEKGDKGGFYDSIDQPLAKVSPDFRSLRPTFAAVYCVYDDTTWLRESIESVYGVVDALYFLVSDRPWFGQATDNKTTVDYIRTFPDPDKKITLIEGNWTNETDQRNTGLDILREKGFTYCLVADADEIYDPADLRSMMEYAAAQPDTDCWHMKWDTYWKSYRYRIDPREPFEPVVFVKAQDARFTKNRTIVSGKHGLIPPETGICHHLSYARSNAEVLKKITTFSHAHEVKPGWFENVWKRWDADYSLTDLHPTHPHNYQRAVEQPYSALPFVLKKRYLSDENTITGVAMIPGLTSIIILVHNRWDQTERCLKSIGRHTPEPHEIIVVDNGSTDETRTRLQMLLKTIPRLKVILNNTNRGYAAGNNQGISIAGGEYILLLNNDTVVTPGWLGRMTGVFKRFPKTGVAGPMSNNVTRPQLAENVDYGQSGGIDGFAGTWAKEHDGQSFTTTKASGFCLLTRREVIDAIGGLDEQFGSGNFEDDDFCSRAFLTGFEVRIVQDVFIHHEGSQTFKGAGIDYNAKMLHNWELYKAKWDIPKDTPLDRYWVPSRLPETVSHFFPLPDLSSDHTVDPENRWWEDFRKKEEQGKEKVMKKERSKGLTSLIILLSSHSGYARTCIESIQRHTKGPHEILFVPMETSYTPLKWLRKMLKENKNYKLIQDSRSQGFKDSSAIQQGSRGQGVKGPSEESKENPLNPRILESSAPVSFALACNRGLAEAKGEYLAILRDTLVVTEEWLSGMREHLNSSSGTGIVGPMTVNVEGRQRIELQDPRGQGFEDSSSNPGTLESLNPAVDAFAKAFRERNRYRRVPVQNLDSFCLLFTHALTEKIGIFDERFETDEYAGNDYCIRAAVEGCQNLIAGDVFIHYYGLRPVPALKDRIAFGKKWGNAGEAKPESQKVYCANALLLSDELSQKGQKEQAVVTLVEGIKLYPEERRLGYALAEILIGEKKYKEALDIVAQMPLGFTADEKRLELLGAATLYLGKNEEADRYADELLLQNNASAKAWNLKGAAAFEKNAYADAERFFQKAVASDGSFGEAYVNIGALRWAGGKKEEALRFFERAFILSPTVEDIVTNYYTAVVSLSQLPAAEKTFKEATALYPFNRRLKFILIDNLLQQGKYPEAMAEMEEALAVFGVDDDTLAVALKLRERIQQDSRIQGSKDSSGIQKSKPLTTVSLCMIVKNEEKNIIRALQSVKPLVDEMIVVDTGSTDRTKKIATAFGAKVYDFHWTESFSDARNFSLSKATGDWILVLDADEVISALDYEKLKELIRRDSRIQGVKDSIQQGSRGQGFKDSSKKDSSSPSTPRTLESSNPVSFSFVTRNYVGPVSANWNPNDGEYKEETGSGWFPSGKVRLFPNDSRIRFEKPVHEVVEDSLLRAGYEIVKSDIPIHHYGKLNTEEIRAKGEEYFQLGKKKLAEQGAEDPKALYELAVQASELEKHDEALEFWQRLIAVKPDFGKAYYGMGTSYYRLARYGEARAAYRKAVEITPGSKDPVVMYATSELIAGDADAAVSLIEGLLRKHPGYPLALLAAAAAYLCAGRKKEGLEYIYKVGQTQFSLAPYLSDIAKLLISVKRFDSAVRLLEAAVETGNTTAETRQLLEEIQQDSNRQDSRIQGFKHASEPMKKKLLTPRPPDPSASFVETPRPLESPNPGTLSLCMIVKNEEDTIELALQSIKSVVDEMIVVDTGSTDRTKEIASELGAKVYDFAWTDNFSDARNYSIAKASGDWILVLDADEVISARDYEKLKQLIRKDSRIQGFQDSSEIQQDSRIQGGKDSTDWNPRTLESSNPAVKTAFSFVTRTYVEQLNTIGWVGNDGSYPAEEAGTGWFPGKKVRLFPNDPRFRFAYPLHERVEPSLIKAGIEIRTCDIPVHHYGNFVTQEKARSKAERYYQLGQKKIAESGQQHFMAFYELALQGAELGKHEETIQYLKKAIELKPDFAKARQSLGNIYYNLARYDEALLCYQEAFGLDPGARDTVLMYATCELLAGSAEKAVALLEEFPGRETSSPQMLLLLAEAYVCAGRKKKGLDYVKKLRELKLDTGGLFNNFAKILISTSRRDYALSILDAAGEAGFATDETRRLIRKISAKK